MAIHATAFQRDFFLLLCSNGVEEEGWSWRQEICKYKGPMDKHSQPQNDINKSRGSKEESTSSKPLSQLCTPNEISLQLNDQSQNLLYFPAVLIYGFSLWWPNICLFV